MIFVEVLYIKSKAKLGIFERVVIKNILFNGPFRIMIYKDTTNAIWNKEELVDQIEAEELVA